MSFFLANQRGLIALITVLIILAVALLLGLISSLLAISEAKIGLQKSQSSQAYYLATLCAEQALMKLKEDSNYSGNEEIQEKLGSCKILPIENNWIIKVLGTASDQIKKIKITVDQINPDMVISSWEEVSEF